MSAARAGDSAAIRLEPRDRELLIPELRAVAERMSDAAAREAYAALAEAVERLEVPGTMGERLGAALSVVLSNGRIRANFGPGGELQLARLFHRTPQGRGILATVEELNAALARLRGQPLRDASVALRAPGVFALTLETSSCHMVVRLNPSGAQVESLEIGLA